MPLAVGWGGGVCALRSKRKLATAAVSTAVKHFFCLRIISQGNISQRCGTQLLKSSQLLCATL